ncbi:MAG: hypothetical protein ACRCXA_01330 [Peptostreptococcaceae bacterium]
MKKSVKILSGVTAFLLMIGILYFANGLMGNPISKMMANKAAKEYINEHYKNLDLEVEDAYYSFKTGGYYVSVKCTSSKDTHFSISVSPFGRVENDSYSDVLDKYNTYNRINLAYENKVRKFFDSKNLQYKSDIIFGEIKYKEDLDYAGYGNVDYGVVIKDLELDKEYDIYKLGKEAGHIVFYAQDEDISVKKASEILLDIKNMLDENNISFYAIDFTLEKPRGENEEVDLEAPSIKVDQFLYKDIYEKDLEKSINKSIEDTKKYYEEQDKSKLEQMIKFEKENSTSK